MDNLRRRVGRIALFLSVHPEPEHILIHTHFLPKEHEAGSVLVTRAEYEGMCRVIRDAFALEQAQSFFAEDIGRRFLAGVSGVGSWRSEVEFKERVPHRDLILFVGRFVCRRFHGGRRDTLVNALSPPTLSYGLEEDYKVIHMINEMGEVEPRRQSLYDGDSWFRRRR